MVTDTIRKELLEIKQNCQRNRMGSHDKVKSDTAVIKYLTEILNTCGSDNMLACFCLWNISDSYALLRESEMLYSNHRIFLEKLSQMQSKFLFWCVCDATQKFTLELGGYSDFWQAGYKAAVSNNTVTPECERIAYEAHRAAMSGNSALNQNMDNFIFARDCFSDFIKQTEQSDMNSFYKLIYTSSCLTLFKEAEYDGLQLCNVFLHKLKSEDKKSGYVFGEWEYLNRMRSEKNQAVVGITAYINALINIGEIAKAKEIYLSAKDFGLPDNSYINRRIES